MRKGLFGLNGFASVVVFIVALALIAAIVVFSTVGSVITVDPVQAPAEAAVSDYQHGSNINRSGQTSGTAVSNADDLRSKLGNNANSSSVFYLTSDITLSASQSFMTSGTFSGTLYGNGHTITVTGSQNISDLATGMGREVYIGGLVSKLTGQIYDLNVVLKTNTSASYRSSGDGTIRLGLIAGVLDDGGTIENCSVTINSGSRLAAHKESSGDNWASAGAVAGGTNGSMTVKNVTVTNNGDIASGLSSGSNSENFNYDSRASASMFVSFIWNDQSSYTQIINNVVAKGSGSIRGYVCSILGMLFKSVKAITVGNYYNLFSGTYDYGNSGWSSYTAFVSYTLFKWETGDKSTVTNYYNGPNTDESKMATNYYAVPSNSIEVDTAKYNIFFDSSKADLNNSLGITYSASNPAAGYERTYTLTAKNGSSWTTKDIVDGKVIFTGLPTAAGTWISDGKFSATLTHSDTELPTMDALKEYEHGYYAGSTPSGTGLNSTQFFNTFVNKNSTNAHNGSGTYYLTEDAYITGFTGRDFRGTLDGNGKTVYIVGAQTGLEGDSIGGIIGELNGGTVKNLRVVICVDVNVQTSGKVPTNYKTVGIGGVVGNITGNSLIENVNVVINQGVTFSTSNNTANAISIGGISGNIFGKGRLNNCTVQLDGTMSCTAGYAFISGIVGNTGTPNHTSYVSGQDHPYMYSNIVLKGGGQFAGKATQDTKEPMFSAALTITDNKSSAAQISIDGFIYALTNSDVVNATISCYGYVSQNKASNGVSSSTAGGLPTDGYITYDNVFTASGCTMTPEYSGHNGGNNSFNISTTATISTAVDGLGGSSVTPYFRPDSSTDITLVATANSWGTYNLIKARGDSTAISVTKDNAKVVDVPKNEAYYNGSITLEKVKTVSEPVVGSPAYTGEELSYTVTIQYESAALGAGDFTATLVGEGPVIDAGDYELEVTLSNGYYFYDSLTDTASNTKNVTMTVSRANVYLTVKLGVNSVEYGGSAVSGNPYVSDTGNPQISVEELGKVSYTYNDQSALPIDAGEYTVKAASVSNSANIDIVRVIPAMLNVTKKTLTLGVTEIDKQFTEITSLNKDEVTTYGDLKLTGFVDADTGYSVSLNDESIAYITDIYGVSYLPALPAGETYTVVVTPNSANYTFGGKDSVTLIVAKNELANRFVTNFSRAGWTYYSEPTAPTDAVARFGEPVVKYYSDAEKSDEVREFTNLTPAGTYYYTVTVEGTDSYNGLTAEGEFVVDKLSVTVSLSAESAVYTANPYAGAITVTVTGTDDSTYPADILDDITYSIDNDMVIEGVLPTDAGTYTLGIASIANSNLEADYSATTSLIIDPKPVSFTAELIDGASLEYGQAVPDFKTMVTVTPETLTGFDFGENDWEYSATSDYTESTTVGAVSVFVTVKITDTNTNYVVQAGSESFTLEIEVTKATIELEVSIDGGEYTGEAKVAQVTGQPEGVTPTVTYYSVNEAETGDARYTKLDSAPVNAGKYAVKATVTGLNDYEDFESGYVEYTIAKATVSFTVSIEGWTYRGTAEAPVIGELSHESLKDSITFLYAGDTNAADDEAYSSAEAPEFAGIYTVKASYPGDVNHEAFSVTSAEFEVARAELPDLAVTVSGWTYDGKSHTVTPSVTGNLENGSETFKYTFGGEAVTNGEIKHAGTYTVEAQIGASANYNAKTVESTFEVTAKEVSLHRSEYSFKFGVLTPANRLDATNYGAAVDGIYDGDSDVYSFNMYIDETNDVSEGYLKVKEGGYTLVITLKNSDYTFENGSNTANATVFVQKTDNAFTSNYSREDWTYYDSASTETKPVSKFGKDKVQIKYYLDEEYSSEYTGSFLYSTPAGTYYVLAFVEGTENYNYTQQKSSFSVSKREVKVVVTAEKTSFEYGDTIDGISNAYENLGQNGTAVFETTGYRYSAAGEEKWTDGLPVNPDVGEYVIGFTYTKAANVVLSADSVTFVNITVEPKPVTFTVSVADGAIYGMSSAEVEELVNIDTTTELEYGKSITVSAGDAEYDQNVFAGTEISIAVSITVNNTNYIASVTGDESKTLVVKKAPLTVTAKDKSILRADIYDYQTLSAIYDCFTVDGLKNGHTFENLFALTSDPGDFGIFSVDSYTVTALLKSSIDEPLTANYEIAEGSDTEMLFTLSIDSYKMSVSIEGWTYGEEANIPVPEDFPLALGPSMQFNYKGRTASGTVYDSSEAPREAGEYTLTVSIPATSEYTAGEASCDFVVSPREIGVSATETSLERVFDADNGTVANEFYTYLSLTDGYSFAVNDTMESVFSVVLKNAASEEINSIYSAGEYSVSLNLINRNYTVSGDMPVIVYSVTKAKMSVGVSIEGWTYGSAPVAPVVNGIMEEAEYAFTYNGTENSGEVYSSEDAPENAGKYTVTLNVSDTDNYFGATAVSAEFTVDRASFETEVNISDRIYGETAQLPSVTVNPGNGSVTYVYYSADGSVELGSVAPVNAGEYKVTATVAETDNYNSATAEKAFKVEKAAILPVVSSVSGSVYSGAAVAATLTEASNPGSAEVTYYFERLSGEEWLPVSEAKYAGSYRVKAAVGESDNYFGGETEYYAFGISAKEITYTWSLTDGKIVYGDTLETVLGLVAYDREGILGDFVSSDREYVLFSVGAVSDGEAYSPAVNAHSVVTFSLEVALDENAGKDVTDSYVVKLSAPAVDSKEVAVKQIAIDAASFSDVYGNSYTEDVSLGEYFGGYFTYNGESVNALDDGINAVEYAISSDSALLPNAGGYVVNVNVTGNYSGSASLEYEIEKAEIALNSGYEFAFGYLSADNLADKGVYASLITGIADGDSLDYVLSAQTADEDVYVGYLKVGTYSVTVTFSENVNYVFADGGYSDSFDVRVVKGVNEWISEFDRDDWTYLSDPSEAVMPVARFDSAYVSVKYYSDREYTNELVESDFASGIPAGVYYAVASVAETDCFEELRGEYTFSVLKLNAAISVSTPDAVYDGAPYDGIEYSVSGADASLIGNISWKYSSNGVSFTDGLPTDAGSYVVRVADIDNDSVAITNIDENFALTIAPKGVNFRVKLKSGATVVYGDAIPSAASFIDSITPETDEVGSFTYTASVVDAYGREYAPGVTAGSLLSVVVRVEIDDSNYVAVVSAAPSITVQKKEIEPEVVIEEDILKDGDSVSVTEGKEFTVIDAILSYLSQNDVAFYEYTIYVDGAQYSGATATSLAPGEHKVTVNLSGNYSGSFALNITVEEDPDAVAVSVREPLTPVGEFLDTINLNMAGALAIVFAFATAIIVILFFGLRRKKK